MAHGLTAVMPSAKGACLRMTAYGKPAPKGRPRAYKDGAGRVRTYTPKATKDWEESMRYQAIDDRPQAPLDGPLAAHLVFRLPRPKSAKKRLAPHTKPDLDNLTKAALDALEGIWYTTDSRIVTQLAEKVYTDGVPHVDITIWEVAP